MGFKRAEWRSGLTYQQLCKTCNNVMTYMDDRLDFRPWYADGYVDCPKCKTHLRHDEKYALGNEQAKPRVVDAAVKNTPANLPEPGPQSAFKAAFCPACGHKFDAEDCFCMQCGKKRV